MEGEGLGELVRRRRLELRLTQRAAARAAGVSLATWQAVERARPGEDFQDLTLARIAHALELPMEQLFVVAGRPWEQIAGWATSPDRAPSVGASGPRIDDVVRALRSLAATRPEVFEALCAHVEQIAAAVAATNGSRQGPRPDDEE